MSLCLVSMSVKQAATVSHLVALVLHAALHLPPPLHEPSDHLQAMLTAIEVLPHNEHWVWAIN